MNLGPEYREILDKLVDHYGADTRVHMVRTMILRAQDEMEEENKKRLQFAQEMLDIARGHPK